LLAREYAHVLAQPHHYVTEGARVHVVPLRGIVRYDLPGRVGELRASVLPMRKA
jgi:hypothetical protein